MRYINVELKDDGDEFEDNLRKLSKESGYHIKSSTLVRSMVKAFNRASDRGTAKQFMDFLGY